VLDGGHINGRISALYRDGSGFQPRIGHAGDFSRKIKPTQTEPADFDAFMAKASLN